MYTDTTLYYLNQIGIRPWIRRSLADTAKQETIKLLVFRSATLTTKSQSLLQQMLHYINLPESDFSIISIQEGDSPNNYHAKIKQKAPLAIWVLGLEAINQDNLHCPVITSINPDHLIKNPSDKRKAFQELHYMKQLIS